MGKSWTPEAKAKLRRTLALKKGNVPWDSGDTTALGVELPEWTGFALSAPAVRIAVRAETRLEVLLAGRGKRPLQRFVVQVPSGSVVSATVLPTSPVKRKAAGPGLDEDIPIQ